MVNLGDVLEQMLGEQKKPEYDYVSFFHNYKHPTGEGFASYRYRTRIPAKAIGARINEITDETKIIVNTKMWKEDLPGLLKMQQRGIKIVADFCDWYFDTRFPTTYPLSFYQTLAKEANAVTVPSVRMADLMEDAGYNRPIVIRDPYDLPELTPHCNGNKLLWFGNAINGEGLKRIMPEIAEYPLIIISNINNKRLPMPPQTIPWDNEITVENLAMADIVILPASMEYKSANRAVESIRQGCFVVAEPHPAINELEHIWIGNIKEGVQWAIQNPEEARNKTALAQQMIKSKFSPQSQVDVWKTLFKTLRSV